MSEDYDIQIVSTYQNKLGRMPCKIEQMNKRRENEKEELDCKHNTNIFPCQPFSIYNIGLSCNSVYIGETSRCPNTRFDEHDSKKSKYSSFVEHQRECGCKVDTGKCFLISDGNWRLPQSRKVAETMAIKQRIIEIGESKVISCPSITVG